MPSFLFCPAVSINTTRKRSWLRSFSTAVQSADTRAPEFITYLPCDVNAAPGGLMSVAPVQARVSLQTTGAASWLSPGISRGRQSSWLSTFLNADGHRRRRSKHLFFWASFDFFEVKRHHQITDSSLQWNAWNAQICDWMSRTCRRTLLPSWFFAEKGPLTH